MVFLFLLLAMALPSPAADQTDRPGNPPWFTQPCDLTPISPWSQTYFACDDTTRPESLGRAFVLRLDPGPDLESYQSYWKLENYAVGSILFIAVFASADLFLTKVMSGFCSPSFNPSCGTMGPTLIPWYYYAGALAVEIPLTVFATSKRLRYQDILVTAYNKKVKQ